MGRDFSLGNNHPSVLINGQKYHYGKDPNHNEYLVESASYEKDYWCFKTKEDLFAFLVNLPESADPGRLNRLYPDWSEVSHEQRNAYFEEDRLRLRAMTEEKVRGGAGPAFNTDLEGEHGPHAVQVAGGRDGAENLRPLTKQLVAAIMLDAWPGNAAVVDFGLHSRQHYEALYYPVRNGEITPGQLEQALGKGPELTRLANAAASNPHKGIVFTTAWDDLRPEPSPPPSPEERKSVLGYPLPELTSEPSPQHESSKGHTRGC